ncbi:MAG TPA: DUF5719 family protein, partial [Actinomycetota bacterium]|nr:DUF5719 family protein [Actinomycetota bacterium]
RSEMTFLAAVVALLGVGLLLDFTLPARSADQPESNAGQFVSTGWYCPVPPGEGTEATMSTANLATSALGLRRSAIGGTGQSEVEQTTLAARSTGNKAVGEFGLSDATGLVEAFGGSNATSLMVSARGRGAAASRCSAQPSSRWLFAAGSTSRGENHYLLISNPFREEAVVRVRLMAGDKEVVPARLRDLVIRPFSQTSVYLSDYLQEEPSFGIEVTASRGRVIVARYSNVTSGEGRGISLDVGAQNVSSEWIFAEGRVPSDGEETIVVVNPGSREALIGVVFMTAEERTAPPELAEMPVPAGRQLVIKVSDHLPRGTSYGIQLSSTNDVPVVAERRTGGVVERNRSFETAFGVRAAAARWTVPAGSPAGGSASLSIVNTGQNRTGVNVTLLGADGETKPEELSSLSVDPGRKLVVDLSPFVDDAVVTALVEADAAVIAVESQSVLGGQYADFSTTPGLPAP